MLKKMLKTLVLLVTLLMLIVSPGRVGASGKMEVDLGEKVTLQAENMTAGSYKWVAKKDKEIITTQSGSIFSYTFPQQGEYQIDLTMVDAAGNTKSTNVLVLVGNRYSVLTETGQKGGTGIDSPLTVSFDTLPVRTSQRSVYILGDEGRVVFDIASREDILEYRIDRNIFVDSDGNGIANDDIDNADHSSYLLGGIWQTKYLASESNKIAAEITVVNEQGEKAKSQVEIIFDTLSAGEGNVVAVLDTLPLLDSDNKKVYLHDETDMVAFYSRRSQGDLIEYRIDKNIFVDSDGDGNPANDIDNKTDNSFKTGDVWTTAYQKTDEQIIAQLIVVGRGGAGSRIQREIVFTDQPVSVVSEASDSSTVIQLTADKEFVQIGDPIVFAVEGLAQSLDHYMFHWDFDGNGEVDQTIEGDNGASYLYDSAGIKPVNVRVQDTDGNEAIFTLDLLVKDVTATTADFEFTVEDGTVTFDSTSVVSPNLSDKNLTYTWSFGDTDPDNYEAQRDRIGAENPIYSYTQPGTYIVTLTVVDSDQVTSTKTLEVLVENVPVADDPTDASEEVSTSSDGGGSILWTVIKFLFYAFVAVIVLILLIILGLLAFLKLQHPDLIFEELIDELKIKLLGMMGVHDMVEPVTETPATENEPVMQETVSEEVSVPEGPAMPEEPAVTQATVEPELTKQDAPVPDWLKNTTPADVSSGPPETSGSRVIEGEVEESPGSESAEPAGEEGTQNLKKNDGPVPDWLKNA